MEILARIQISWGSGTVFFKGGYRNSYSYSGLPMLLWRLIWVLRSRQAQERNFRWAPAMGYSKICILHNVTRVCGSRWLSSLECNMITGNPNLKKLQWQYIHIALVFKFFLFASLLIDMFNYFVLLLVRVLIITRILITPFCGLPFGHLTLNPVK